ncbi:hypothetical protein AN403_5721 [Pseudomonas fluorescens]|uniref:Uncharacterized protein n=1 Tax=Pseudomonas fluorescens TaxID=294 RepID=A0A0P8X687_PSEFL|nr:hypothetical protein AN403_5721 [Pseudomonas fluorescens]
MFVNWQELIACGTIAVFPDDVMVTVRSLFPEPRSLTKPGCPKPSSAPSDQLHFAPPKVAARARFGTRM